MSSHETPEQISARLRRARMWDRFAKRTISVGGVGVLAAVIAIFVFIGWEALPLLKSAVADLSDTKPLPNDGAALAVVSDEYREVVSYVDPGGEVVFLDAATGETRRSRSVIDGETVPLASAHVTRRKPLILAGTLDGRVGVAMFTPEVSFDAEGVRTVDASLEHFDPVDVFDDGGPVSRVSGIIEDETVIAVAGDAKRLSVLRFRTGMGRARVTELEGIEPDMTVTTVEVASFLDAFRIYAGLTDGRVLRWDLTWTKTPELFESFEASDTSITALQVLLGEETLIVGDAAGNVSAWSGVRPTPEAKNWNMRRIRGFPSLPGAVVATATSPRAKTFLALDENGNGKTYHNTTARVLTSVDGASGRIAAAAFAPKSDGMYVAQESGELLSFDFVSTHPEATVAALFLPVWYEGATEPRLKWQSTGGSNDFEPKLSVTTLVFGSLKGVFYALFFSIPLALAAAIYTSLFLPAELRGMIKPAVEIMAALPSVVVGLLAALWLSPIVEQHLTEFFTITPAFLLAFTLLLVVWRALPRPTRISLSSGPNMMFVSIPGLIVTAALAVWLGPVFEEVLFGGDVKAWLRAEMNLPYDPRNALVVGFAMGFAVVPVIFTIAEDAISNVPKSLWAASEALGASRWQTTYRVVLPAAAPGIFAALMLGFGRAIGETMIVLMATGNTPILDMSPFNGMRTISACIAVEIPEAPHGGTLYRVLFFAGALLFAFTFLCNTVAEVIGHKLRQKYGRF
jgi:phosphate transport system permease protein